MGRYENTSLNLSKRDSLYPAWITSSLKPPCELTVVNSWLPRIKKKLSWYSIRKAKRRVIVSSWYWPRST